MAGVAVAPFALNPQLAFVVGSVTNDGLATAAQAAAMLISVLASNVVLWLGVMLFVDWQPQGRYLFPSLAALVVAHGEGLGWLCERSASIRGRLDRPGAAVVAVFAAAAASGSNDVNPHSRGPAGPRCWHRRHGAGAGCRR
jgi:hypothetical protein